jgi:hypothetical protein
MHRNDHDIIALWSMHNPQNAAHHIPRLPCRIACGRGGVDRARSNRADRCFDSVNSDAAYAESFLRVLSEADHPSLAVMLGDLWIEELAAQRFEALEGAFLIHPHQPATSAAKIAVRRRGLTHPVSPAAKRRPDGRTRG